MNANSTTRKQWSVIWRTLRALNAARTKDCSLIGQRARLHARIAGAASNGYVGVYWSGTDCDGQQWRSSYAMPSHLPRLIERRLDSDCDWLDGPANYTLFAASKIDIEYYETYEVNNP